jgi:hypothetical protein
MWFKSPGVTGQKAVPLILPLAGTILVAAYWAVVWYRQKKWSEPE